ncbi:ABZJ_00895 family protein [Cognatishimia sp. F0-27]|uniref:ABZJ_00895 family protein n=1 Tax=Cognatishimia sp. F0-27 TaxID=2816855 RepID=UPI001D0C0382|nr:ABZJ_00895 family protein [Cognatishimia sp. F0-27]MCC1491033.1 ABZJ_00895 family protein [Cognatishimia sp. F0-27]
MGFDLMRYAGVFLTVSMVMMAARAIGLMLYDFEIPPGLLTVFPAMAAAQSEGRHRVRTGGEVPEGGAAWAVALGMTGIAAMFTLSLFLVQAAIPGVLTGTQAIPTPILLGLTAVTFGMVFLVNRLFFTLGALTERRAQRMR